MKPRLFVADAHDDVFRVGNSPSQRGHGGPVCGMPHGPLLWTCPVRRTPPRSCNAGTVTMDVCTSLLRWGAARRRLHDVSLGQGLGKT